jgi:hypothetical protein
MRDPSSGRRFYVSPPPGPPRPPHPLLRGWLALAAAADSLRGSVYSLNWNWSV